MTADFSSLYNQHEREVFAAMQDTAKDYPDIALSNDLLCDVACVALNRLPPRYIRHAVDYSFYLTERERREMTLAIDEAVRYAYGFVQARMALKTRG